MAESIKTPGLLLQSISYLGQKKILKVLTPDHGLISLFTKSTKLTPFCLAEWVYRETGKEMHTLQDSTLLDPLLNLRQDYQTLTFAGAMAQDLLRTQMPNKKAPYALASAYFKKLPLNPQILAASFRLKLLLHEGLLSLEPSTSFSPLEWEQLSTLAFGSHFSQIQKQTLAPFEKIELLFNEAIS
ncbi:MAG: hypothetical protein COT85_07675 [Chlamydiae bacterium CG10_big_fil_rev_8_21_14_0_10_42_34]|nr:MAG: hypothetical protein COT85_07675 [Chlamydiae bacterium CG10_big_fil_rev_8_21_14_0_10_42_34]